MRILFLLCFLASITYGAQRQLTQSEQYQRQHMITLTLNGTPYEHSARPLLNATLVAAERAEIAYYVYTARWRRFRTESPLLCHSIELIAGLGIGLGLGLIDPDGSALALNALALHTLIAPTMNERIHF